MITLNQLIYDLWHVISPLISDDSALDERQLSFWIKNQRSLWLHRELNKGFRTVDDAVIQSLGAVEFEIVDAIENSPYVGGSAKILKSKVKIPVAVELDYGTAITRVGPLDLKCKPFKLVNYSSVPYVGNGKFNKNQIFAFLKNGYVYLTSNCNNPAMKVLKYVNIQGVFEDPEDVGRFRELDGSVCWSYDTAFPINTWMINYMKDQIVKSDLKYFIAEQPVDKLNDADSKEEVNVQG